MGGEFIIETRGLTKQFRGFVAVSNVDLKVRRHTIHALIGPNGAGKTTCFNLITRFLEPSQGRILFNGRDITRTEASTVAGMGMVRSFQISAVFGRLTALENVRVALQRREGGTMRFWRTDRLLRRLDGRALELLEAVGIADHRDTAAAEQIGRASCRERV